VFDDDDRRALTRARLAAQQGGAMESERAAETVEPVDDAAADGDEQSATELLEQLAREVSALALCEARLAAARHRAELRRAGRDAAAALLAAVALLAAFVFANAAALYGLSTVMADWAAALLLAGAWAVVGVVLALLLRVRVRRASGWDAENGELARAEAEQAVRETLGRLAPVVSKEIALAAVPAAGDIAGGLVDAGDELIDSADEIVDAITDDLPAGGVVNQIWDVVLIPGRIGIRVATTVLRR
jgi:hypothetical protein